MTAGLVRGAGLAAIALAAMWLPVRVVAQVLEIDSAGAVTTYSGPTVFRPDGSSSTIRPAAPAPRPRAAPAVASQDVARPSPSLASLVVRAADAADLSPDLVEAVAWCESRLHARIVSPAGAIGEMQLMPDTARALGVDPYDSEQNFRGGAGYLKSLLVRYHGDLVLTLAAYNAGPHAVDKYGGVPPYRETRNYVSAVLDRLSWRATQTER